MSILINQDTAMLIIGITGKQGRIHCKRTLESGGEALSRSRAGKRRTDSGRSSGI